MPARAVVLGVLTLVAVAVTPALGADAERGRALYENHCQGCHSSKIHGRRQRWPADLDHLRNIVGHWQGQQNLRWTREEIEDVVYFLNVTHYNY